MDIHWITVLRRLRYIHMAITGFISVTPSCITYVGLVLPESRTSSGFPPALFLLQPSLQLYTPFIISPTIAISNKMCIFSYTVYTCGCDSKKTSFRWRGCGRELNCSGTVEDVTRVDSECVDCTRKRNEKEQRAEEKAVKKAEKAAQKEAQKNVEWRPWKWGHHEK